MQVIIRILVIIICSLLFGCKSESKKEQIITNSLNENQSTNNTYESGGSHDEGEFCATVDYNNYDTGTSSTYTLTVHVENGKLVRIDWPSGGWLDDTHFDPPNVDDDGACSFVSYDGKEYDIQIDETGGCSINYSSPEEDDEDFYEKQRIKLKEEEERLEKEAEEREEQERVEEERAEEEQAPGEQTFDDMLFVDIRNKAAVLRQ